MTLRTKLIGFSGKNSVQLLMNKKCHKYNNILYYKKFITAIIAQTTSYNFFRCQILCALYCLFLLALVFCIAIWNVRGFWLLLSEYLCIITVFYVYMRPSITLYNDIAIYIYIHGTCICIVLQKDILTEVTLLWL